MGKRDKSAKPLTKRSYCLKCGHHLIYHRYGMADGKPVLWCDDCPGGYCNEHDE